jgi:predicted DsbA family dithiol-disulfide isomerase
MHAVLWRDFLCPWCYLGRDRTALMEALGVTVAIRSYELHPEIPLEGRTVRPDGRFATVLTHIGAECEAVGLPFRPPSRIPNTRHALETAEVVAVAFPDLLAAVDAAVFDGLWVHDLDVGDPEVVDGLLAEAGVDPTVVATRVAAGEGAEMLDAARAVAAEHDVTGTPAWWVDDRLLIPGVQDRDTVERWISRLSASRNRSPDGR